MAYVSEIQINTLLKFPQVIVTLTPFYRDKLHVALRNSQIIRSGLNLYLEFSLVLCMERCELGVSFVKLSRVFHLQASREVNRYMVGLSGSLAKTFPVSSDLKNSRSTVLCQTLAVSVTHP